MITIAKTIVRRSIITRALKEIAVITNLLGPTEPLLSAEQL